MLIAGSVDLTDVLSALSVRRPVFHSEADLQFAMAWAIQTSDPLMEVYLETRPEAGVHLDLEFHRADLGLTTAIEVKYLTKAWKGEVGAQQFELRNHSAHDFRRYDVVKDISRVERFVAARPGSNGAVVVLTNDPAYLIGDPGSTANDVAFRIHRGATLEGERAWIRPTAGTDRLAPITLRGRYELEWGEYATLENSALRSLVIQISPA